MQHAGFSLQRLLLLQSTGSRRRQLQLGVAPGLQQLWHMGPVATVPGPLCTASIAVAHWLSCSITWGSRTRDPTCISGTGRQVLYHSATSPRVGTLDGMVSFDLNAQVNHVAPNQSQLQKEAPRKVPELKAQVMLPWFAILSAYCHTYMMGE